MSPAQGRFTSPDRPFADQHIGDPQSWNMYSYGRNNPLVYTDPTGECIITGGTTKDTYCGGSVTVTASPDVTPIDPFWNECFGPAAAYSMRCFGAYLEPGMVIVNTDPGDDGGGGGGEPQPPATPKPPTKTAKPSSNPCSLPLTQRALMFGNGVLNLATAGVKFTAAGTAEVGSSGILTGLALYGAYSGAGNLSTGLIQTIGALMPNARSWQRAATISSTAGTISGLTALLATHGDVSTAAHFARWEGLTIFGFKGGLGAPPSPLSWATTGVAVAREASSDNAATSCH